MLSGLLAITSLHIVLLAVCAFLVVLLILLGIIFSGRKKRRDQENEKDNAVSASVTESAAPAEGIRKKEDVSESAEPAMENTAVSEPEETAGEMAVTEGAEE